MKSWYHCKAPGKGVCAVNSKIVERSRNNILLKSFRGVRDYFREVREYFREGSAYFRGVSESFVKLVDIFAWKPDSRTSKQVARNLGPLLCSPFRATGSKIRKIKNGSKLGFQAIQRNWG